MIEFNQEQAIDFAKKFINEIDTQENRTTASPLFFLLQRKQQYVAHDEYNHQCETRYYHHVFGSYDYPTHGEAVQALVDYGYEGEELAKEIEAIQEFQMGHYWETENVFFTNKGLQRHYDLNRHNLRKHRDYVIHAFRNPEMQEVFAALRVLAKINGLSKENGAQE